MTITSNYVSRGIFSSIVSMLLLCCVVGEAIAQETAHTDRDKTIVVIFSEQASGSTLLKALLAMGGNVSHLPETPYWQLGQEKMQFLRNAARLSKKDIIVLKEPFSDDPDRPELVPPLPENMAAIIRSIILVRDIYDVVSSASVRNVKNGLNVKNLVRRWQEGYNKTHNMLKKLGYEPYIIRYEDLVSSPIEVTKKLFAYISAERKEGVDHYEKSGSVTWGGNTDNGSAEIHSLKVQPGKKYTRNNQEFLQHILASKEAVLLLKEFGYYSLYAKQLEQKTKDTAHDDHL